MRCFLKLLGISYRDHITNEEVKARTGNAIGPYEDLLTSVKRQKTKVVWARHTIIWTGPDYPTRNSFKGGDEEADRGNDGETTSKSGLALNGIYYHGKPRKARSGGSWL